MQGNAITAARSYSRTKASEGRVDNQLVRGRDLSSGRASMMMVIVLVTGRDAINIHFGA